RLARNTSNFFQTSQPSDRSVRPNRASAPPVKGVLRLSLRSRKSEMTKNVKFLHQPTKQGVSRSRLPKNAP
ncbi:hypothetical protein, partial [Marivivens donghaensis]|uniref:hypothetical protein n=1 Tax=Marivivens donghaensis TaxID=1699413 RepID=UPI0025B37AB4